MELTSSQHGSLGTEALVVGGGMGGMMAAEVLSRYFDHVTLVDKDSLSEVAEPRTGVPQGNHIHTLLTQGRLNLETLFPGYTEEMIARGATSTKTLTEFLICDFMGGFPQKDVGLTSLNGSRPLIEGTARTFLNRNPKVTTRDRTLAQGWHMEDGRVAGVVIKEEYGSTTLPADLVIDASGRAGGSLGWLEAAGIAAVPETVIEIGITYASAVYRKPENWEHGNNSLIYGGNPKDGERSAGIFAIEDNCWLVTLIGRFDKAPPSDPDAFLEFAKLIEDPRVHDWISKGERLTPIKIYRPYLSKWRHYDQLPSFPEGLLPIGDAIAQVNPARGQGMTLASTHAMTLLDVLDARAKSGEGLQGLARPYFDGVQGFTQTVWQGLEIQEYQCDGVKGDRPEDIDQRIAFFGALRKLASEDVDVLTRMMRVNQLIDPPSVLQTPEILEKVMAKLG